MTCNFFNNDRVLLWRLILKEYGKYIEYIKGEKIWWQTHNQHLP